MYYGYNTLQAAVGAAIFFYDRVPGPLLWLSVRMHRFIRKFNYRENGWNAGQSFNRRCMGQFIVVMF